MAKKIYDIKPPKVANKVEDTIKSLGVAKTKKYKSPPVKARKKEKKLPWIWVGAAGVVALLFICVWGYVSLPKAEIFIWPKTDTMTLSEKVTASTSATAVDLAGGVIPARYVEETQTVSQDFPATGSASNDGKAKGTITVYNSISPASSFALKAGTHFLSDGGKYFVTLGKVTVPAMQGKTPGSIKVAVQAEESGSDYNIGASKFSAPKLSGTSYYYSIWAESTTAMTGGFTGDVKKVTSANIADAKYTLTKKLQDDTKALLVGKLSADEVLLDTAVVSETISASANMKPDAVADTFTETASVKVSGLVFKKQDLEQFVKNDIASQLDKNQNSLASSLQTDYKIDTVDVSGGTEKMTVQTTIKTYQQIDTIGLVNALGGKSESQIKDVINGQYGNIDQIKVRFWPLWVKTVPGNKNKTQINLNF